MDDRRLMATIDEGQRLAESGYLEGTRAFQDLRTREKNLNIQLAGGAIALLFGTMWLGRSIYLRRKETEALRLERERVNLSRERLARIGEISAGVAHTIRNPLHGILNCVDLLKAKISERDPGREILALMEEGLHRIELVTQRLLVLTRSSPPQRVSANIVTLIEDTLRFVEMRCRRKGVRTSTDFGEIPALELDPNQLSEALLNVLDNALDATGPGETISIRTRLESEGPRHVCIEIADSGEGIPAEDLARVFDPFFTTKPVGEGSGLGLAITRRIIEENGGQVEVESQLASGTRVRLLLPCSPH